MRTSRLLSAIGLSVTLLLGGVACSGDDTPEAVGTTSTVPPRIPGDLTVAAAASLTEAFSDAEGVLEDEISGLDLTFSFAGSGALVTQVQEGAPVDVLATADRASIQSLADLGIVGTPVPFARNQLQILVAPGNPLGITGLADLDAPDVKLVLGSDSVPVGRYAAEALAKAGVTVSPVSEELDVKSLVARVASGEADAAIVYATDVQAVGAKGEGIEIPAEHDVTAEYFVAIVSSTGNIPGAEAYVEDLVSGDTQDALQDRGFLPPA